MNYLHTLIPNSIPESIDPSDDLKVWQERFLYYLLIGGFFIGLALLIIISLSATGSTKWTLFTGTAILTLSSLFLILQRRLSYWSRSITELAVIYIFSTLVFAYNGWSGVALIVLLGFSFLSTILLFRTPARIGLGISLTTVLFWAVISQSKLFSINYATISIVDTAIDILLVLIIGFIGNISIQSLKTSYLAKRNELIASKNEQTHLSQQLLAQAKTLERRLFQLKTASEISQKVSTILDPDVLIQQVSDLVKKEFDLYYVGVFLIDKSREYAVLRYGTGDAGRRMMAAKHRLAVGGYSMIGWATQTRKPRIALDIGKEAVHFDNPFLPNTRSELALPIISGINVLGALTIQSEKENAFDDNDILILQSVADNIGIALENANSFQKTQAAMEEIRILNKDYVQQSWWNNQEPTGNIHLDFENENAPEITGERSVIQVPLKIRDEVIGQFNIETNQFALSEDQVEFIESISTQTSIALENARLLIETQRAALQEQKINEITAQISNSVTIEEIIKKAVTEFGKLPAVSEASISLLPPDDSEIKWLPDREVK